MPVYNDMPIWRQAFATHYHSCTGRARSCAFWHGWFQWRPLFLAAPPTSTTTLYLHLYTAYSLLRTCIRRTRKHVLKNEDKTFLVFGHGVYGQTLCMKNWGSRAAAAVLFIPGRTGQDDKKEGFGTDMVVVAAFRHLAMCSCAWLHDYYLACILWFCPCKHGMTSSGHVLLSHSFFGFLSLCLTQACQTYGSSHTYHVYFPTLITCTPPSQTCIFY